MARQGRLAAPVARLGNRGASRAGNGAARRGRPAWSSSRGAGTSITRALSQREQRCSAHLRGAALSGARLPDALRKACVSTALHSHLLDAAAPLRRSRVQSCDRLSMHGSKISLSLSAPPISVPFRPSLSLTVCLSFFLSFCLSVCLSVTLFLCRAGRRLKGDGELHAAHALRVHLHEALRRTHRVEQRLNLRRVSPIIIIR